MYLKENMVNIVKRAKRMTDFLGHSNIFATLSLSLSLRYSPTIDFMLPARMRAR